MSSTDSRICEQRDHAFEIDDLKRGAVHVWLLELDEAESVGEIADTALKPEERAHAARIGLQAVRQRFVSTRILLRSILGRYLHMAPDTLYFEYSEHGKPRLAGTEPDRGLVFNLSHTENRLAVALAFDTRLGVDIESWRPIEDPLALASRCLAPPELLYWCGLPEAERLPAFFRVWTLKEAFSKAVGRGLALGLQRCVFDCSAPQPQLLAWPDQRTEPARRWYFYELADLCRASGAVASDRSLGNVRRFGPTAW